MSEEQAYLEWQKLFDAKQTVLKYRNALAGNGGGTVNVAGEPGYIWCRYSADQSKVSKVFNIIAPGIPEDFPIVVGRRFPTDESEQVLAVNWTLYQDIVTQDTVDNFTVGNHGESHNAASGSDPAPIDLRNLLEMRMRAQATPDLTVHVERGQYRWFGGVVNRFPGQDINLAASVPGVVGHRYVLVHVNAATNILGIAEGAIVPIAFTPPIPDITANTIPVGIAELRNAQTTIDEDDIFDWRFLFQVESYNSPPLIGSHADRLALVVADLEELTRFYESDTDQVWEIWEGAWRISYPPPALTAPDGAPSPAWSLSNTGVMTGVADLVLDDGVGDSPALTLVGGTNDDQVLIFLDDAAGIGQSDLTIDLADAGGNSAMIVRDSGATPVFEVTSAGFMTVGAGTEILRLDTTECVFNEDSADIDFRFEGNADTHALFLDAGLDRIGIGESSPVAKLHVTAAINTAQFERSNAGSAGLNRFYNPNTTDGNGARLVFATDTDGAGASALESLALIDVIYDEHDHATRAASIDFLLSNSGNPTLVLTLESDGDLIPGSAKAQDLGSAALEWDNIYYVTAVTGTSRLVDSTRVCPVCGAQMKRGTGTVNVQGEDADYALVFCVACGVAGVEEWKHLPAERLAERRPAQSIVFEGMRVRSHGRSRTVAVDFRYGDGIRNSTVLSDAEIAAYLEMDERQREAFLLALGQREWDAREEQRIMRDERDKLQARLDALSSGIRGADLKRIRDMK